MTEQKNDEGVAVYCYAHTSVLCLGQCRDI